MAILDALSWNSSVDLIDWLWEFLLRPETWIDEWKDKISRYIVALWNARTRITDDNIGHVITIIRSMSMWVTYNKNALCNDQEFEKNIRDLSSILKELSKKTLHINGWILEDNSLRFEELANSLRVDRLDLIFMKGFWDAVEASPMKRIEIFRQYVYTVKSYQNVDWKLRVKEAAAIEVLRKIQYMLESSLDQIVNPWKELMPYLRELSSVINRRIYDETPSFRETFNAFRKSITSKISKL